MRQSDEERGPEPGAAYPQPVEAVIVTGCPPELTVAVAAGTADSEYWYDPPFSVELGSLIGELRALDIGGRNP